MGGNFFFRKLIMLFSSFTFSTLGTKKYLLKVEFDKKNQLTAINPGAAGKHGFHRKRTMIRFKISKNGLSDMEIIELGERGKLS